MSTLSGTSNSPGQGSCPRVVVKSRRARALFAQHPWLFAGSIERVQGSPADGDQVCVHSQRGEFIGWGLYNSQSQIRVRLYSWADDRPLDDALWRDRLAAAIRLRREILNLSGPEGGCRLVFSEADGLSGLVVDRYGPWLVLQFTSLALAHRLDTFVSLLIDLCSPRGIYLRTERAIGTSEGLALSDTPVWGETPPDPVILREADLDFEVDLCRGQKTGWYLDQRENRQAAARLASGRRVLDVFCYTGGFALAARRAGAREVLGVDVSESAIACARRNALRNQLEQVTFEVGDAFRTMERLGAQENRFDMVIVDPPKFARQSRAVEAALRGYLRANLLAARLLNRDGILVTCSCSGLVSREQFAGMLGSVAERSGRPLQIIAELGQPADHPVSPTCPESAYLKCVIARVV
jgi:23S rRNA (cytosine1962-C5)-methyltransferase